MIQAKSTNVEVVASTVYHAASTEQDAVVKEITNPNDILKYGVASEALINHESLSPMLTGDVELDKQVLDIFDELINETMSNYEKVLAIYEYVETSFSYSSSFIPSEIHYISDYDGKMVGRAKGILTTGHGTCTEFSAAFMVMMRALGFDAYCVQGCYSGGAHTWVVMVLDGERYIFDPQIDFRQWQGKGEISLTRFCMDESFEYYNCYNAFDENGNISSFNNFAIIGAHEIAQGFEIEATEK